MRYLPAKLPILVLAFTALALCLPDDPPAPQPRPGAGMFLMLSDLHFDPYSDLAILRRLGVTPTAACQAPASAAFAQFGSDTNGPLLQSALDRAAATAAANHFHYDYVMVTGDFLSHHFDQRFRQCVGGGEEAYTKFAADTVRFVDAAISKALPGVPIIAALGNNDSDKGDYIQPSGAFLQSVGEDWSRAWGKIPEAERAAAIATFDRAGNYAVTNPAVPKNELVVLNSNLWAGSNSAACTVANPDPGGQLDWLRQVLEKARDEGRTASLIAHIPPGVDALRAAMGRPRALWAEGCTQKLSALLSNDRGVALEMYAGHIHRDDFRILPDPEGRPLLPIHIVPAVSPIYLDNPAIEIGWCDKSSGQLLDYSAEVLDLVHPNAAWAAEYDFTEAYGGRLDLSTLEDLSGKLRTGNPHSGLGKQYAAYYGAGVSMLINSGNWLDYTCAQTEMTLHDFAQCVGAPK